MKKISYLLFLICTYQINCFSAEETPQFLTTPRKTNTTTSINIQPNDNSLSKIEDLLAAIKLKDTSFIRNLIKRNRKYLHIQDKNENNFLHLAVKTNAIGILKIGLKYDLEVNCPNIFGITPLHIACNKGYAEIVRILLAAGANPNAVDSIHQYTPLHYAVDNQDITITKMLLKNGSDVHVHAQYLQTPLHLAADNIHAEMISLLLNYGAYPNVYDMNKDTPLHFAVFRGSLSCTKLLLNQGSNPKLINKQELTAFDIAREKGYEKIAKILSTNIVKSWKHLFTNQLKMFINKTKRNTKKKD